MLDLTRLSHHLLDVALKILLLPEAPAKQHDPDEKSKKMNDCDSIDCQLQVGVDTTRQKIEFFKHYC